MNQASEKRLQRLHPALATALRAALDDLARRDLVFEVVQGLRTYAEQDALYAQGRTSPGPIVTQARGGESNHNFGLAADLCPFVDGRPDWNAPIKVWAALGAAAEARGLEWGGSWKKFLDKPHVQLPSMTVAECQRCYADGGLESVWAKATSRLSGGETRGVARTLAGKTTRSLVAQKEPLVIDKRVTVILYGADRTLWRGGPLQIRVSDVFASGGPRLLYTGETAENTLELALQLPFDSQQVYGLTFSAPDHHPAWQLIWRPDFLRGTPPSERDDLILRLMLVPKEPGTSDLPLAFDRLAHDASPFAGPFGMSAAQYAGLASAAQMACCNVEAKLRESLVEGSSLLSYVRALRYVAVDRVFVYFDASLKARVARAADFAGAPGHPAPKAYPDLPAHPDSWKHTRFPEGNMQLSFSAEPFPFAEGGGAMVHSADVDIDLGRGVAHASEWLENNVFRPGHKTDQVLVYGLLYAQNILPRYTLDPVPTTVGRGLTRLVKVDAAKPARAKARSRAPAKAPRRAKTTRSAKRKSAAKSAAPVKSKAKARRPRRRD